MKKYILALDQGTTSSRAILFDRDGQVGSLEQQEFRQIFPEPGWVEHDPNEIWLTQARAVTNAMAKLHIDAHAIAAIGITNQRETTVIWERATGRPIYNAIVWQDRRTASFCEQLKEAGLGTMVFKKTGLPIDAYFSASKIAWILNHIPKAHERAQRGELAFGTIDSWLAWNLTDGKQHVTDVTNASRSLLFNIHTLEWDDELLEVFSVPRSILPTICSSSEFIGTTQTSLFETSIPIAGMAGDQHAALFGQLCTRPGMAKNTYGTGCFLMMNTGTEPIESDNKLITTIAWKINQRVYYALEGSIFIGGALIQWLRDGLGIIKKSSDINALAASVPDSDGVVIVPAFVGLGAPHWNPNARGSIFGITRGTTAAHIARAALEAIAFQTCNVILAMQADFKKPFSELRVDGGAAASNLLMQCQADLLGIDVVRPTLLETTALGAAYLAGLAVGFWSDLDELTIYRKENQRFSRTIDEAKALDMLKTWQRALNASIVWANDKQL